MTRSILYDPECEDLAFHFLGDGYHPHTSEQLADLARAIQRAIEDWFDNYEPPERED